MYFKPVLVVTSFLYILICHHHFIAFVNGDNPPVAAQYQIGDAAINCGSNVNSTALDGREWIGDPPSKFLSGKSRSSTAAQMSFPIDPVPYKTSRISATEFRYTFEVNPGQKFIRLHFYPASYRGFENSVDFFTVKAGPFTLLRDFSASLAADISGMKYIVKEFCLNVEENKKLNIIFSPSLSAKSKRKIHAFVNGIEIISVPTGLYHTPDGDLGARIVGLNNRFYIVDNSTALELIERLNIGGSSILPVEDFGMFRRWSEDASYLLESRVHRVSHLAKRIKYTNMPAFIAPPKLYQTSWKTERDTRANEMHKLTWKIPVDFGFGYLVRLHFCQFDAGMTTKGQREFNVLINNHITEAKANVIGWSGGNEIPIYRDYLVIVKGEKEGSDCDLLISLQSVDMLIFGILNGLEIFKLSNLENSLATPNPTFPKRVSTSWNFKIRNLSLAFCQSNAVMSGMTILMIMVNVLVYYLRQIWEEKFNLENDTQADTDKPSYRRFSLAEVILATQNFSDEFVIGRGGFGKVYKGLIHGISEIVAIKRLSSTSRQGAHEFWAEIETLSKLRHNHLVSLIGYCNEEQEMILVYEYMRHGTLADHLYKLNRKGKDISPLTWEQRLRICIGAARGLEYLHTGSECGIIHRDVKDLNILLNENFVAKISDFGLSKLEKITLSKSYVSTNVKGTIGYLDPDYFTTHRLTRKSDVYAFGVVLLVVLAGRPAVDTRTSEEPQNIVSSFRECIAVGDIDRIVDASLQGKISSDSLTEFIKSVENCLHQLPKKRPTMAQVVASLEQALAQQEIPMVPTSGDTTVVGQPFDETVESLQLRQFQEAPMPEESDMSPVIEGLTSKRVENLASSDLQSREDYAPVRKPFWGGWPWKSVWNRGKPTKRTDLVSPNSLGPGTSVDKQLNNSSGPGTSIDKPPNNSSSPRTSVDKQPKNSSDRPTSVDKKPNKPSHRFSYQDISHNFTDGFFIDDGSRQACMGNVPQLPEVCIYIYKYWIAIQGEEVSEFCNEMERLSQLRHPNLLSLLGYCYDEFRSETFLLYDHIGFDTLHSYLYGRNSNTPLRWNHRLHISIGVAQGLDYLHNGTGQTITHREVRPVNILLDEDLCPKILNSGLSKLRPVAQFKLDWMEYLSPEAMTSGLQLSCKSDVYSFGLVLLELLCSQRRDEFRLYFDGDERYLGNWVKNNIKTKKFHQLLDSNVQREIAATCLAEYLMIAFRCLGSYETNRPSMDDVIKKLKFALEMQENAEARKRDFKGNGSCDGFNLEDIYEMIDGYAS